MGTFRDPSTINNVGPKGGATNPETGQALPMERENQKAIREMVGAFGYEALTISAGGITPTKAEVTVDTEAGASADDLTTIYLVSDGTTTLHDGMLLKLRAYDPARVVTVKHGTGTNQIQTISGTAIVLGTTWDLTLKLVSGVWKEIAGKPVVNITGNAATATSAVTAGACSGNAATATTLAQGAVLPADKGGTGVTSLAALSSQLNIAPFPSGTRMLFQQTSAPTGWTKDTSHNDKALRVVSGTVGSGGSVDFSNLFGRTATDAHTLTADQMPSHSHDMPQTSTGASGSLWWPTGVDQDGVGSYNSTRSGTASAGSGGAHAHNIDMRVKFVDLIIAQKD